MQTKEEYIAKCLKYTRKELLQSCIYAGLRNVAKLCKTNEEIAEQLWKHLGSKL